jgi:hypothetical protein
MFHRLAPYARQRCAFLAFACVIGCGRGDIRARELVTPLEGVRRTWEEVFDQGRKIHLEVPGSGPQLLQVGKVLERSDGTLVIPDGRNKRVFLFAPDGKLVRELDGGSGGPLQLSILRTVALDVDDDLFLFDPDGRWITVLQAPEHRAVRRFQIPTGLADLVVLPDGSFVAYSPTEEDAFQKFDPEGTRVASTYRVADERLRTFHARIQTGGLTRTSGGEVVGIHPAAYELVRMSPDFEALETLRAPDHNRWQPYPAAFPEDLSPYDYTPAHESWWDTFDHIGTIHSLNGELVLVTVFSSRGLREWTEFANIYQVGEEVRLLAAGLRVPQRGRIVGAAGREVYIVRNARLGDGESLNPLALYTYSLTPGFP